MNRLTILCKPSLYRNISTCRVLRNLEKVKPAENVPKSSSSSLGKEEILRSATEVPVSGLLKNLLIIFREFKTKEEIPNRVGHEKLQKLYSKIRIKASMVLMALILLGCVVAVVTGKKKGREARLKREKEVSIYSPNKILTEGNK